MSPVVKYYLGAGIASILALIILPNLIAWLIVLGLLAAPVAVYFMLDESQRTRLRRIRRRQIGG
ncbi:hypothetical protein [Sphaerisporangium sp. TRM90804]|uniref:hypothetical protein n=1 Tax=Sphaerisporangium sp. TRM90804 TaxID=3031113 RepID=UPI00244882FA|nr:hypothetical protein [Sphaerisporangium sp. TRM90804]MDH2427950.1 hypothetical protein [Sphaerisporangium sp. TRM90804]